MELGEATAAEQTDTSTFIRGDLRAAKETPRDFTATANSWEISGHIKLVKDAKLCRRHPLHTEVGMNLMET